MPAADQLYLLYQQSKDLCASTITKWEEHFQWLREVQEQAKESRGQTIVPKTPATRRRKIKKQNDENDFVLPNVIDAGHPGLRKSSRAAAKVAQERTNRTLLEISNIKSKLRRPSTPKKISRGDGSHDEERTLQPLTPETKEVKFDRVDDDRTDLIPSPRVKDDKSNVKILEKKLESDNTEECTRLSAETKPKKRSVEELVQAPPVGITTQTKRRKLSDEIEILGKTQPNPGKDNESMHLCITGTESDDNTAEDCSDSNKIECPVSNKHLTAVTKAGNRITRSKVRHITTMTNSSPKPTNGNLVNTMTESSDTTTDSSIDQTKVGSPAISRPLQSIMQPSGRITRSKVRKIPGATSSEEEKKTLQNVMKLKAMMNKECHTPKKQANLASGSPHCKARQTTKGAFEVQEVSMGSIEVNVNSSPGKVVKHTWTEKKVMNPVVKKGRFPYQTPSPGQSSGVKIHSGKRIFALSSHSQKRGLATSSPQIIGTKVIGTPTEVNRTKNIVSGASFLTKVLPMKPTREQSEERKQDDIRKKWEREEETRRKKEELLRLKMEEQKRKNEERMRRVQEARDKRDRKAAEERELQEKERRLREERIKEGKKNLMAAKKNEELRQQMLRKQMEAEQRLKEEQRIWEEEKLQEQELEQKLREMKIREEMKRVEQKREAEKIAKEAKERFEQERLREAERIARERREIEQLKLKEMERKASPKKLNETYTADPVVDQRPDPKQSYAMTPEAKAKIEKKKKKNANDYGIGDLRSDDSTDEECAPKKEIPFWAKHSQLKKHLFEQEHFPPHIDALFPPKTLLKMPDLILMFPRRKRSRFTKRTSSAVWSTPPCSVFASSNR